MLLNIGFYVLFLRFLGREKTQVYETKCVSVRESESLLAMEELRTETVRLQKQLGHHTQIQGEYKDAVDTLAGLMQEFDVLSFDIFDTLIFRPFSEPGDLFFLLGEKLGIADFKRIRMEQEALARQDRFEMDRIGEITLRDIWERIECEVGIPAHQGMEAEQELELSLCYANPWMQEVWNTALESGKQIVLVSDMYLPGSFLEKILRKNGFTGYQKLYVSCEHGCGKWDGKLYVKVMSELPKLIGCEEKNLRILHIGDNPRSDGEMARKAGWETFLYPNSDRMALSYRPYAMSPVIGGAYRGIADHYLYCGRINASMEYEYGFLYGGLFVLGFCGFLHDYCRKEEIDRILFLSRDGETLKLVFDQLFPGEQTEYVYWSRKAALKLMADHNRYDYFRRFLYHKLGQSYSVSRILKSMELSGLEAELASWTDLKTGNGIHPESELTSGNVELLKRFLEANWTEVLDCYREQNLAAEAFFSQMFGTEKVDGRRMRAVAVDIGWAGSGALSLAYLAERVWKLPCEVIGMVAGTNTVHNAEPDASEAFLQSGKLVSYMYSASHNRDLWLRHDPAKGYNIFWELLLSSPEPQFQGYYADGPHFGVTDVDPEKALQIRQGILDFVEEYSTRFKDFPQMFRISGRDAYAPLLTVTGQNEKYLREIEKRFHLQVNVD